tara:strand:- start:9315 stop:9602 length:288 start_codon:yes stop_codon:yes gene_type:complete
MSYVCRCNNGHRPAANSGCDKANCRNCCKGKGGVNPDSSEWGRVEYNPPSDVSRRGYRNASGAGVVQAGLQGGLVVGLLVVGVLLYAMVRVSQTK